MGGEYLLTFLPLCLLLLLRPREQVTNATSNICGTLAVCPVQCLTCTLSTTLPPSPRSELQGIAEGKATPADHLAQPPVSRCECLTPLKTNDSKTLRPLSKVIRSAHFAAYLGNNKGSRYRTGHLLLASHCGGAWRCSSQQQPGDRLREVKRLVRHPTTRKFQSPALGPEPKPWLPK